MSWYNEVNKILRGKTKNPEFYKLIEKRVCFFVFFLHSWFSVLEIRVISAVENVIEKERERERDF